MLRRGGTPAVPSNPRSGHRRERSRGGGAPFPFVLSIVLSLGLSFVLSLVRFTSLSGSGGRRAKGGSQQAALRGRWTRKPG